jgi:hypothetical protein
MMIDGSVATRQASAGTPPWVAVLGERRYRKQQRTYSLACGHVATVMRVGSYPAPRHVKCKACPPSEGPPGGKRSHHVQRAQPSRRLAEEALERACCDIWGST